MRYARVLLVLVFLLPGLVGAGIVYAGAGDDGTGTEALCLNQATDMGAFADSLRAGSNGYEVPLTNLTGSWLPVVVSLATNYILWSVNSNGTSPPHTTNLCWDSYNLGAIDILQGGVTNSYPMFAQTAPQPPSTQQFFGHGDYQTLTVAYTMLDQNGWGDFQTRNGDVRFNGGSAGSGDHALTFNLGAGVVGNDFLKVTGTGFYLRSVTLGAAQPPVTPTPSGPTPTGTVPVPTPTAVPSCESWARQLLADCGFRGAGGLGGWQSIDGSPNGNFSGVGPTVTNPQDYIGGMGGVGGYLWHDEAGFSSLQGGASLQLQYSDSKNAGGSSWVIQIKCGSAAGNCYNGGNIIKQLAAPAPTGPYVQHTIAFTLPVDAGGKAGQIQFYNPNGSYWAIYQPYLTCSSGCAAPPATSVPNSYTPVPVTPLATDVPRNTPQPTGTPPSTILPATDVPGPTSTPPPVPTGTPAPTASATATSAVVVATSVAGGSGEGPITVTVNVTQTSPDESGPLNGIRDAISGTVSTIAGDVVSWTEPQHTADDWQPLKASLMAHVPVTDTASFSQTMAAFSDPVTTTQCYTASVTDVLRPILPRNGQPKMDLVFDPCNGYLRQFIPLVRELALLTVLSLETWWQVRWFRSWFTGGGGSGGANQ